MTNLQKNLNGGIISQNSKVFYPSSLKTAEELAKEGANLEPLKCIWGEYILENSLIHHPSERGTGKTLLGLEICLAVSSGWKSFCGESIDLHGNALFLNYELNEDVIKRRMDRLFKNSPNELNQKKYKTRVFTSRHSFFEELPEINSLMHELQPVVVFVDNYKLAFKESDGNSNKEVAQAINQILALRDCHQCSIVIIDHTKKNTRSQSTESDLQSGAGSKSDLSDGDYFLRKSSKNESLRILKRSKSRNCPDQNGAKLLKLNPETLWFEMEAESVDESAHLGNGINMTANEKKEMAFEMYEKGMTMELIATRFGVAKSTVSRWISGK
nr:AAA family ATPase [uncultured Carboxylicivirga sp.]